MLIVALAATSNAPAFGLETRGHIHGTMGIHVGNNKPRAATCHGGEEVPPNQTTSIGLMLVAVDVMQNTITLFALVNDIPPQDITAAQIHLGQPGQNGPPVYDLALAGSWQPLGPQGSVIAVHETPFPVAFMPLLLSEQCYFNVATVQHPAGAIRGQIDDISRENTGAEPPGTDGTRFRSYSVPNPFVDRTFVQFALQEQSRVSLRIYNASGRLVRTLADGVTFAPGSRGIEWDGTANDGHRVARGIYVYKLQLGSSVESRRVVFLR
jgi:hypothetical protein